MRFGLWAPTSEGFADPVELVELAVRAEECGYHGFFLWDHLWQEGNLPLVDAWVVLAAAAQRTETIHLGPLVTPLPRSTPWDIARRVLALQQLAPGRVVLGVGKGLPEELAALGILRSQDGSQPPGPSPERNARFQEALNTFRDLVAGRPVHVPGGAYPMGTEKAPVVFTSAPTAKIPIWSAARISLNPLKSSVDDKTADGYFPIPSKWKDRSGRISPQQIAEFKNHVGGNPDIAMVNTRTAAGATIADYEKAGVTWWLFDVSEWDNATHLRERLEPIGPPGRHDGITSQAQPEEIGGVGVDGEMNLRISKEEAHALEVIAQGQGTTTDEVVRAAIEREIDAKRNDPEFQARLRLITERDAEILDRLAR